MQVKRLNEWWLSAGLHAILAAGVAMLFWTRSSRPPIVDITVLESPRAAPRALEMRDKPPEVKPVAPRQVFGQSRKALTGAETNAVQAKAGNTVAKEADREQLRADDADSIPIPTDEYLVTQMPELAGEVRVPYPPGAKSRKEQGAVIMDILIDGTGKVREAKLVQGPSDELNQAALAAVQSFVFRPAMVADKAVAVRIRYAYRFVLEK